MSELSCIILCGILRNSTVVITAGNASISLKRKPSLSSESLHCDLCASAWLSHHSLNSAPHARSQWLCPHHLPGSSPSRSLPAPVTALVHSVSTGNALLDDFAAFLHFPRDRTAGKGTSRLGTIFKQCFYFLELAGLFWLNVKLKGGKTTTGDVMVILILIPSL